MTNPAMGEVTGDDKLWAALAYAFSPLVPLIIMFMGDKKDRPFIKQHNVQALILGIIMVVTSGICIGLFVWVYQLYCAYQAYQGNAVNVPGLTDFVKNQGWA